MLSVYAARLGADACVSRNADLPHYAASTMKVAVLAALYRSGLDLDAPVPVRNSFFSAVPGPAYGIVPDWEIDPGTWRLVGERASLRWLARQMVVHSSDLAANHCLAHVGLDAVAEVWRLAGARHSSTRRGIQDFAARAAGVTNLVTAADLARLLCWLPGDLLELLAENAHRVDLAAGLPPGTWIAFKNGWVPGVRHSAGIVRPPDAPPYVIAVCYTGPLATGQATGDPAARLLARISATLWSHRDGLGGSPDFAGTSTDGSL
ncbi:serine hydrolase [Streptomyces gobiensis]|uniref:serine hydrolase n=1 Tax=Streptomyces gobiensis TaxID=2875706 RepID=UPI001E582B8B|nr:serine hydrolase [Streptomyces gobiensis]UGY92843.1 class A beta-lactamase-related serine hydrolase [Streptomyces gobiensis]